MSESRLPIPTPKLLAEYNKRDFDDEPATKLGEKALSELFSSFPKNAEKSHVLLKVVALNRLYSTNIFAVVPAAEHIHGLKIDRRLDEGDPSLVKDIAQMTIGEKQRNNYSFATKYCSWHREAQFPMWDWYADEALWEYRKQTQFDDFRRMQLREYLSFITVIRAFQSTFGLHACSYKEMDKFLWIQGYNLTQAKQNRA